MGRFYISANEKDEKIWRDTVQHYLSPGKQVVGIFGL